MSKTKWRHRPPPFHPSPLLPSQWCEEKILHSIAARVPCKKQKAGLERNGGQGRRATIASRPYLPFEAMSRTRITGRQATAVPTTEHRRLRFLAPPPASGFMYASPPTSPGGTYQLRGKGKHGRTPGTLQGYRGSLAGRRKYVN